jgi:hypothetical protein
VDRILPAVNPNPPRMITVVISVVLLIVGLALFFYQGQAVEFVRGLTFVPNDLQRQIVSVMTERVAAWVALAGSPILLIIGSLLPNI